MATAVFMPKAGMTMKEGKLIRWLKEVGDTVELNEYIMEIETDKITMEAEAPASGVLLATYAQEGDVVPVLQTIGWIGQPGEKAPKKAKKGKADVKDSYAQNEPPLLQEAAQKLTYPPATPYAKTLIRQMGIPGAAITPTGKHGELRGRDVLACSSVTRAAFADGPLADEEEKRIEFSGARKVIARRVHKSCCEIPAVTQTTEVDMSSLLIFRETLNGGIEKEARITINDFILRAAAIASLEYPAFRTSIEGEQLVTKKHAHVGLAVAAGTGLIVPVIRFADTLSLARISAMAKDLVLRARTNKLMQDEYAGSTITVSNLGMYGVVSFTPIINQPNSAVLGVCCIREVLSFLENGPGIYVKKMMNLCLTYDHRIMDGADAALFSLRVKALLEAPQILLGEEGGG